MDRQERICHLKINHAQSALDFIKKYRHPEELFSLACDKKESHMYLIVFFFPNL